MDIRKASIVFIIAFLAIIYVVPISQAAVEIGRGRGIQVGDILVDLLYTPLKRANQMHDASARTSSLLDTLASMEVPALDSVDTASAGKRSAYFESAARLADDALVAAGELHRAAGAINRHVALDTAKVELLAIDSLQADINAVLSSMQSEQEEPGRIAGAVARASAVAKTYPKRTAVTVPILATQNVLNILWNDKYVRAYEKEMENTSVAALGVRPVMQFMRYALLQNLGEKAIMGEQNWFYFMPDVQYLSRPYITEKRNYRDPLSNVLDPDLLAADEKPLDKIVAFKEQLAKFGVEMLVVIVPGKPSIYPELCNAGMKAGQSGAFSHSLRFMAELRQRGVECVDLFTPFAQERLRDTEAGDSLYLEKDTHWRGRGVLVAARTVAERVKQYPWYTTGTVEYAVDTVEVDREGDVGVMSTLPAFKIRELGMRFPLEKTTCYQVYKVARDETGTEIERTLYRDELRASKVLILGDSFSRIYQTDEPRAAGWIANLARELGQPVASVVSDGGASTLVREKLARKPDVLKGKKLVIWEFVERDIRFGAEGWKDIAIEM